MKSALRSMVDYREFNLLQSYSQLGQFDIVFCRNVLIFFDQETKAQILSRIADCLPPDGLLFLGGAETVLGISEMFQPIPKLRGVYEVAGKEASQSAFLEHPAVAAFAS